MNEYKKPEINNKETEQKSQFSQKTVYVKEDDQDWGSSGMNDIHLSSE